MGHLERLRTFLYKYIFHSFKTTMNMLFLPIVILCILVTGGVSTYIATAQIEENTYQSMNDTIYQTKNYLDHTLSDLFSQLVSISYDSRLVSLLMKEQEQIVPEDYIPIDKNLQIIYGRYSTILESATIDLNVGEFLIYQSEFTKKPVIDYDDFFVNYKPNSENFKWKNVHEDAAFHTGNSVMSMYKLLELNELEKKGIVLFNIREEFFGKVLSRSLIGENGYLALISEDGIYQSKELESKYTLDDKTFQKLHQLSNPKDQITYTNEDNEEMIVIYDTLESNGWKIAAIVPEDDLLNKVEYIKIFALFLIIIMIGLVVFVTNIFISYMSKPFQKLAKQMDLVNENHLYLEEKISGPKEMRVLNRGFIELIDRINVLMDQVILEQEEKRQLEFAIMHAQINPHFLYNTLYSIKGLCDMGMTKEASQMVTALSNFFRIGISKGKEIISVKEEIEHIENYLIIQEMRYGDDFTYEIEVEGSILDNEIVKLSLQPLIENAIYHGVKQKRSQGKIVIKGYRDADRIYMEVIDNGSGISEERLEAIHAELQLTYQDQKQYIGIGIKSVNDRIKMQYGEAYGLTIRSVYGEGTSMIITIPVTTGGLD